MPRYKLHIAYDGTDFCGWQRQEPLAIVPKVDAGDQEPSAVPQATDEPKPNRAAYSPQTPLIESTRPGRVALRTVQGVIEAAVWQVTRQRVEVLGSSRTDSGVHAKGQVAAFTCEPLLVENPDGTFSLPDEATLAATRGTGWPHERGVDRLAAAINSRLPDDVLISGAALVDPRFDPIGDVEAKGYSYVFHVGPARPLWERRVVHHIHNPRGMDAAAMNEAAKTLVGEHDFAAFAAAGHGRATTVRTVLSCGVTRESEHRVRIDVSGTGFLWNMVRIIAGTLQQVGLGQRTAADVKAALESRDRIKAGPTVGPEGLCLEWIKYRPAPEFVVAPRPLNVQTGEAPPATPIDQPIDQPIVQPNGAGP